MYSIAKACAVGLFVIVCDRLCTTSAANNNKYNEIKCFIYIYKVKEVTGQSTRTITSTFKDGKNHEEI